MPDHSFTAYLTAAIYWALIVTWAAILIFYWREYRWLRRLSALIATLIVIIFIDGARTLCESLYFGTWYTARTDLIPYWIYEVLSEPQYVLIPKLLNLIAALLIGIFLIRRWFRDAGDEARMHLGMQQHCVELEQAHEELQQLERLRDDLVHMVVHDMRTPLTSVLGSLQTALDGELSTDIGREMVENALEDARKLRQMTSDLLDVTRLERGEMKLEPIAFDLAEAFRSVTRTLSHAAAEAGVTIRQELPEDGIEALADARLAERVLTNLVQNAIRHTPPQGTVSLGAGRVDAGDRAMVVVSVADTGEGIPAELQERIFDKFFHAERHAEGRMVSVGLGLAFCKMAVEAHGGTLSVESAVGEGSTFMFTLPMA